MKALQKRLGITTIYVTHDQVEAMTMADRIALMDKGSLLKTGTPDDIYSHPATEFVGGFIGSPPMNFLNCSIHSDKGRMLLEAPAVHVDVTEWQGLIRERTSDSSVVLGVRPEDLSITNEETAEGITGEVYVIEPLGSELIINIRVGEAMIKVKTPPTFKTSPGASVRLSLNRERLHIFDEKTRKAII